MSRVPRGWGYIPTSTEAAPLTSAEPGGYAAKHDPEVRFKEWKRQVDLEVQKRCGLSADDLPDCPYREWFDSGVKPASAACKAIKRSGDF